MLLKQNRIIKVLNKYKNMCESLPPATPDNTNIPQQEPVMEPEETRSDLLAGHGSASEPDPLETDTGY
jgi:hypothetical protein